MYPDKRGGKLFRMILTDWAKGPAATEPALKKVGGEWQSLMVRSPNNKRKIMTVVRKYCAGILQDGGLTELR
eukprot:4728510-Pyramimonas_sp.AAC.1